MELQVGPSVEHRGVVTSPRPPFARQFTFWRGYDDRAYCPVCDGIGGHFVQGHEIYRLGLCSRPSLVESQLATIGSLGTAQRPSVVAPTLPALRRPSALGGSPTWSSPLRPALPVPWAPRPVLAPAGIRPLPVRPPTSVARTPSPPVAHPPSPPAAGPSSPAASRPPSPPVPQPASPPAAPSHPNVGTFTPMRTPVAQTSPLVAVALAPVSEPMVTTDLAPLPAPPTPVVISPARPTREEAPAPSPAAPPQSTAPE